MEKMSGHTRLYRRGATYYHRAGIPVDIKDTYPKTEETFSLRTKDYHEALKKVRIAAVEVDQRFEAHRQMLARQASAPVVEELTIRITKELKLPHLVVKLKKRHDPIAIINWLDKHSIETVNIAGPRESKEPGVGRLARELLDEAFQRITGLIEPHSV
jgi:hypothetical protein